MIHGTYSVKRVIETTMSRISERVRIRNRHKYKIHSTALMPQVGFGKAITFPVGVDSSIFINDGATKPRVPGVITCQNFLTTEYNDTVVPEDISEIGDVFTMTCLEGNPNDRFFRYRQ